MYFSHHKKFFYIHNWRTGGSSVEAILAPHLPRYLRSALLRRAWASLPVQGLLGWERAFFVRKGHMTAAELKAMAPPELFGRYFKFGFVRNPWDWHVSLYHYILRRPRHRQYHLVRSFRDFADYVRWKSEMDVQLQKQFFYDAGGACLVDYIGRYETLEDEMAEIARRLDLGDRTSLPRKNAVPRADWRTYYDDHTFELIGRAYAEDVRLFGYHDGGLGWRTDGARRIRAAG
jgi:hypothetical protein